MYSHIINLLDSPTAGVGKLPINTSLSLTDIVIEGVNQPTFYCTGRGYPTPMLSWEFNGDQTLPSGIVQYMVHTYKMYMYDSILGKWTSPVGME